MKRIKQMLDYKSVIFILFLWSIPAGMIAFRMFRDKSYDSFEVVEKLPGFRSNHQGTWIKLHHGNDQITTMFIQDPFSANHYEVGKIYVRDSNSEFQQPPINSADNMLIGGTSLVMAVTTICILIIIYNETYCYY